MGYDVPGPNGEYGVDHDWLVIRFGPDIKVAEHRHIADERGDDNCTG